MIQPWALPGLDPGGGYDVVYADPAWRFRANTEAKPGRNAMRHYRCMRLDEIAALPVKQIAARDALLFFWITGPFFVTGAHLPIMKAWGFRPTSLAFTWVKLNPRAPGLFWTQRDFAIGGGLTTRKNAEFCILGRRGKGLPRCSASIHELVISPRREHSRKPEEVVDRIQQYVGPGRRYAEMFSRTDRPGWDHWGDEAGKFPQTALVDRDAA